MIWQLELGKVVFLTCSDSFGLKFCSWSWFLKGADILMCMSVHRVQYVGQRSVPVGHYLRLLLLLILGITSASLRWQPCWTPSLCSCFFPSSSFSSSVPYFSNIFPPCHLPLSNLHRPCFWLFAWYLMFIQTHCIILYIPINALSYFV